MRHEHDAARLAASRRQDIILAIGRAAPACRNNEEFSGILWSNGIGNALRVWSGWAHDWPYWEKMIRLYIGGHDQRLLLFTPPPPAPRPARARRVARGPVAGGDVGAQGGALAHLLRRSRSPRPHRPPPA